MSCGFLAAKDFLISWLSNILAVSALDKYYSRNASCTLNLISTLLFIIRRDVVHTKFDFYIIVYYSSGRSESCDLYNIGSIKEMWRP